MALITQAEYARRRGVTKVAVHNAVRDGRISLIDGKVDPEQADRQWAERSRRRSRVTTEQKPEGTAASKRQPGNPDSLNAAQTRKERANAELRELELRRRSGELAEIATIKRAWSDVGVRIREGVMGLKTSVTNRLPAEWRREVTAVLEDECRKILTALSDDIRCTGTAA